MNSYFSLFVSAIISGVLRLNILVHFLLLGSMFYVYVAFAHVDPKCGCCHLKRACRNMWPMATGFDNAALLVQGE
jgi:hypothetical protein